MFNTIKSKIIFITFSMFAVFCVILAVFSLIFFRQSEFLVRQSCGYTISAFAEIINNNVTEIENNVADLALFGELYYKTGKNKTLAEHTISSIFELYPISLGGGIWFKPYVINKSQKYSSVYAYRNRLDEIVIDKSFESESYNYFNQSWYKEIMPELEKHKKIVWSFPYFEKEGSHALMVTAGSGIYINNKLIGLSTVDWEVSSIINTVSNMRPTKNSFAMFADANNDYIFVSTDKFQDTSKLMGKPLKTMHWYSDDIQDLGSFVYHGTKYISFVKNLDNGMLLIVNVPEMELYDKLVKHIVILLILLLLFNMFVCYLLYKVLENNINNPIKKLIKIANKIKSGKLDTEIKVEKPEEFAKLAATYDKMIKEIKYITTEKDKIQSDLLIAKEIQHSSLPIIFPPFPDRHEFEIYASMDAAKDVGGDFYDFYFINKNELMFLIADISGKGIPAALFMMTTKTLVHNLAQNNYAPEVLIKKINEQLCSNNRQGFFVTMLIGIINVRTGKLTFINCGHNPPLIKRANGQYEYLELDTNVVLGFVDNFDFKINEMNLNRNDMLFLYTDGITEAVNRADELYGEEKLLECINDFECDDVTSIIQYIKSNVIIYMDTKPQSDDMTMLSFKYIGETLAETYEDSAEKHKYKNFNSWLLGICKKWDLSDEIIMRLELASEEVYTNICCYGYKEDEKGSLQVNISKDNGVLTIQFKDSGMEYNPLAKPDPDINLPIEEREIGGLGIYMVKQSVDDISYEYQDGQNILTLVINLV